jgi:L-asparaginase II
VPSTYNLDVIATRGEQLESHHRVHGAVVDASDELIGTAGNPELVTFWRSCAKPFQVMPLIESGGFESVGWGLDELALACASHGGEPEHVAIAESMLHGIGFEEGDLACGPHEPLSSRGAKLARDCGVQITRLHNNCSGKHAAMLARAKTAGWPAHGYQAAPHQVQQSIFEMIARWTGVPVAKLGSAIDGCGVVVFSLPLANMARAYARLVGSAGRREEMASSIVSAFATRPQLIGGTDRFDSVLATETGGRILAKVGAEGVHVAAVPEMGLGLAIKVEDGSPRAQHVALLRLLQRVGALPETLPEKLADMLNRPLRNTRGETVGMLRPLE